MKTSWLLRVSDVSQYLSFQIYLLYVGVYRLRLLNRLDEVLKGPLLQPGAFGVTKSRTERSRHRSTKY